MSDLYEDQPGDSLYVKELKARGRELSAARERFDPPPPRQTVEERFYTLPSYAAAGPGPVVGGDLIGSYEAAGVVEPTEQAFAAALHLQPAAAKQLFDFVQAAEGREPDATSLVTSYLPGAASVADAANRRAEHVGAAVKSLNTLGGTYAASLAKSAERLPKAVLDLVLKTVDVKRRVVEERPH
jgi:hypothetical protein